MSVVTLQRLAGITLGAISMTIMAWKGFDLSFGPFLLSLLEELEGEYTYFFGFVEPQIRIALDYTGGLVGLDLQLLPHWKHAFVLIWLFFSAYSRTQPATVPSALPKWGDSAFLWAWSGFVALSVGIVTGTRSFDTAAVLLWPIAAYFLFMAGNIAWSATFFRVEGKTWVGYFAPTGVLLLCQFGVIAATAILLDELDIRPELPFLTTPSPWLALLAISVFALANAFLLVGVVAKRSRILNIGIDMLSTIGCASIVVLLGMAGF